MQESSNMFQTLDVVLHVRQQSSVNDIEMYQTAESGRKNREKIRA